ncbi:hypothetical protein Tco_1519415, partial [Tanacetum coccineum]
QITWKSSEEEEDDEVNVTKDNDDDANNNDDVNKDNEDDDADNQDDEIPDDANQDDDDEQTDLDNDDDEVNEEESDDKSNEDNDEEAQGANIKEEDMDEEATHEEDEVNELYRDVNINLEGRDTVMTDASLSNVQGTQVTEDTHVIITTLINPKGIDTIFTPRTEANLLVDVSITTIAEPPLLSVKTIPPTPLITHMQQTPVSSPTTDPSSSLQDLANMHEAVKIVVQLQSERLRDEAQAENADFLNKLYDNIKKIIKDQVKEQVTVQTSLTIAANLSELELIKILIDKMESNKSIHISDEQKNLYKALVDAYKSDKLILDTYGDTISFKRRRDDEDKGEEPSAGSN